MAGADTAAAMLATVANLRDQAETLDGPERALILRTLVILRDQVESAAARAAEEARRAARGIGAPARFARIR